MPVIGRLSQINTKIPLLESKSICFYFQFCLQKHPVIILNEHMHLNMITVYKYMHKNGKTTTKVFKSWVNIEKSSVNPHRAITPRRLFYKIHHQQRYIPR